MVRLGVGVCAILIMEYFGARRQTAAMRVVAQIVAYKECPMSTNTPQLPLYHACTALVPDIAMDWRMVTGHYTSAARDVDCL